MVSDSSGADLWRHRLGSFPLLHPAPLPLRFHPVHLGWPGLVGVAPCLCPWAGLHIFPRVPLAKKNCLQEAAERPIHQGSVVDPEQARHTPAHGGMSRQDQLFRGTRCKPSPFSLAFGVAGRDHTPSRERAVASVQSLPGLLTFCHDARRSRDWSQGRHGARI